MDWKRLKLSTEQPEAWVYQVRDFIRTAIQRGELRPGEQLPPVRQLAHQLGVHFSTVARAYRILAREGWVHQRRGRGTFVSGPKARAWAEEALEDLAHRFVQQAAWLGFGPEAIQAAVARALERRFSGQHPAFEQKEGVP